MSICSTIILRTSFHAEGSEVLSMVKIEKGGGGGKLWDKLGHFIVICLGKCNCKTDDIWYVNSGDDLLERGCGAVPFWWLTFFAKPWNYQTRKKSVIWQLTYSLTYGHSQTTFSMVTINDFH